MRMGIGERGGSGDSYLRRVRVATAAVSAVPARVRVVALLELLVLTAARSPEVDLLRIALSCRTRFGVDIFRCPSVMLSSWDIRLRVKLMALIRRLRAEWRVIILVTGVLLLICDPERLVLWRCGVL